MTRRKGKQASGTPEGGNRRWKEWSAPVFAFLKKPRTFHDQPKRKGYDHRGLDSWAAEFGMGSTRLVNCLAWLQNNGLVLSGWVEPRVPYWAQPKAKGARLLSATPPAPEPED